MIKGNGLSVTESNKLMPVTACLSDFEEKTRAACCLGGTVFRAMRDLIRGCVPPREPHAVNYPLPFQAHALLVASVMMTLD